ARAGSSHQDPPERGDGTRAPRRDRRRGVPSRRWRTRRASTGRGGPDLAQTTMKLAKVLPLVVLFAVAASLPRWGVARHLRPADAARFGDSPPYRALTSGGVLTLRAPGSQMIRVPAGTFRMGSTPEEMVEAF